MEKRELNEPWYTGDTLNYSIGQGYLLCTPLQVIRMTAAIANGGYLVRPHVVKRVGAVNFASFVPQSVGVSDHAIDIVKQGLYKVVNEDGGTGEKSQLPDIRVSGKTGTAQTHKSANHGWFAGYAPSASPKVCVLVLIEFGGKGSEAASIAGEIFRKCAELSLL